MSLKPLCSVNVVTVASFHVDMCILLAVLVTCQSLLTLLVLNRFVAYLYVLNIVATCSFNSEAKGSVPGASTKLGD